MAEHLSRIMRFAGFLAITALLFFAIQPLYLPLGEVFRWRNFLNQPGNSIDVVFLGTSHTYHSFNPQVIDDLVPIRSHTVGIPGDNIQVVYHEIRAILRNQQPEMVFVDAFSLSMTHWLDGPYVYRFLNASFTPAHILSSADILFKNSYVVKNYFPFVRYTKDRSDFLQLFKNPTDTTPPEYPENPQGHAPLTNIITDEAYANIPMESYLHPIADQYLEYTQKVIDLSKEESFTLAFTETLWKGFENPVYDLYDRSEALRMLSKEGIRYYDFRTYPWAYDWTQIHMYDRDHPSEFGSLIHSVRMAELISELMDLPLDDAKLAWYSNFFFEEFTLTQHEGSTRLQLIPANPEAPLTYCWQLLAWDETTPLNAERCGNEPAYDLETPSSGQYRIAVAITQEGGEYELEGRFPLIISGE